MKRIDWEAIADELEAGSPTDRALSMVGVILAIGAMAYFGIHILMVP